MPNNYTLIANSGIQVSTFQIYINTQEKFKKWFREWYDTENGLWCLASVYELRTEEGCYYYDKRQLAGAGYLSDPTIEISVEELKGDGITALRIDDENCPGVSGEIFSLTFTDRVNTLASFENVWLPLPYFFKRTEKKFKFGPCNWARMKLIPQGEDKGGKTYNVVLAFDTRAKDGDKYIEYPVFPDRYRSQMDFALCGDEFWLMDYCSAGKEWSYIDNYLFQLVHPDVQRVGQLKGTNLRRTAYSASYIFLINYLAQKELLPLVTLYKDTDVAVKDIDMVIDIGNSRTTALLVEDNQNFNQVRQLELTDYTDLLKTTSKGMAINKHCDPFDMRLAFRKVDFGNFGIKDSKQFVYPSLVRLGREANTLIHRSSNGINVNDTLATYSSPKRYLWDGHPSKEEWTYLVLEGEADNHILNLQGITNQLRPDGTIDPEGAGGSSFHYSRRSLMTFAFLEMLVQARTQINNELHRSDKTGFGNIAMPRKLRRLIVTCPTAMSKLEREELVKCAKNAAMLLENFDCAAPSQKPNQGHSVEVVPAHTRKDSATKWYYDEATCAQLVYMYGEVGHKYKGCSNEFFNLYGKTEAGDSQPSLTVGSIDIGGGTSDLMINKYTYIEGDVTTITPEPKFYDSFYYAGDDMLYDLIKNVMLLDENSAFRSALKSLSMRDYRQKIKDFFGEDYSGQTVQDRILRRDFNIQYCVPLMHHYLQLLKDGSNDCVVNYKEVFSDCPPSASVIAGFRAKMNVDITTLQWNFKKEVVSDNVRKSFEPLLKKIATIMYAYACDVVLLSGRPASLPAIRDIFLKYYSVSPNRLILLNNYYVGDWYPFGANTGYIKNEKTIVAMGGLLGYYATELSNLDKFVINLDKLNANLQSTVNYIESSRAGMPVNYFITPDKNTGDISVSNLPAILNVSQIGMEFYPIRPLYSIDFNRQKMGESIIKKAVASGSEYPTEAQLQVLVNEMTDKLRKQMPFKFNIERDIDDKEKLTIVSITDKDGTEVTSNSFLEINIQSMGIADRYWLDSGAFNF